MAGIRIIKNRIDSGELGALRSWSQTSPTSGRWSLPPDLALGIRTAPPGAASQLAIHQFDVLHFLGGEISEVSLDGIQALAGRRRWTTSR